MSSVEFAGEVIPISVVRSARRRTVGITVKESGEVVLRIPPHVSEADALRFAQEKAEWIVRHRKKFAARKKPAREYAEGDVMPFFGRELTVCRVEGRTLRAEIDGDVLRLSAPKGTDAAGFREAVVFLYCREALHLLRPLVSSVAEAAGVEPPALRVRLQERKWGCCTPKNGIILNVRLLLAPELVIRYLVVHEVAHIRFRHHQESFWAEVERLMPEYREAERLIREDGWQWVF